MKRLVLISCLLMALLVPTVVLASYTYYIPITIYNNSTTDYSGGVPVLVDINNTQLDVLDYILASGLDTFVFEGASNRTMMVADDKLGVFLPLILSYQTRTINYRLGYSPAQTTFPVIIGVVGSNITTFDNGSIELGNNFSIELKGWFDATASGNLASKSDAISIEGDGSANITVTTGYTGDTTLDLQVEANLDDAGKIWDGGAWVWSTAYTIAGYNSAALQKCGGGYRFQTVNILNGSVIDTAYMVFTGQTATAGANCLTRMSGEDVGDAVAFSSEANFDGRARTTAVIDWDNIPAWSVDEEGPDTTSPEIKTIIKEIVDRGDWVYGNDMVIFWDDFDDRSTHAAANSKFPARHDDAPTKAPKLHIEFTPPGGASVNISASGVTLGEVTVIVAANTTHLWIDIDGSVEDASTLGSSTIPDLSNNWSFLTGNVMPYMEYLEVTINGTQRLWYQPNTMVDPTNLVDRSGNGNTGTINWGANPSGSGIEVTVGGILPFAAYVPPGAEDGEPPTVLPEPTGFTLFEDPGADIGNMPLYPLVNRAAISLGFSDRIMYSILMLITAVGFGFGALVATGTIWGFTVGFGITMGAAAGTGVPPWWLVIFPVLFSIFVAYIWRQT